MMMIRSLTSDNNNNRWGILLILLDGWVHFYSIRRLCIAVFLNKEPRKGKAGAGSTPF